MQDSRELDVWRKGIDLTTLVYAETRSFPADERFGLVTQMRRSAVSIPSNIAEGCGRQTRNDFARFLRIAYGSACELETQCRVALRIDIGSRPGLQRVAADSEEIRRMLASLQRTVQAAPK